MHMPLLIGLAAGLISAIVFVSATTGHPLAQLALFLVTPLPLYLAGLGLGWTAATAGAVAGFLALALATTPIAGMVFAASTAIPATVLTYLTTLSRPLVSVVPQPETPVDHAGVDHAGPAHAGAVEWYPVGRLVLWAALMAGFLIVGAIVIVGQDVATLKQAIEPFVRKLMVEQLPHASGTPPLGEEDLAHLAEIAVYAIPAAGAVTLMGVMLVNLYLSGLITLASGRLARPWPDLAAITLPPRTPLLLAVAIAATFVPGLPSLFAAAFAGSLYLAYVLLGLAIIHFVTRGQPWRTLALWLLYIALLVMNTGVSLIVAILGLSESFTSLRRRPRPPPPAIPPDT